MATQTAVNRPTAGSNPAPGATTRDGLPAEWIGRSPPKAALGVRISPGRHLVRYASGKRGGCLPPKASSILVRTAHHARVSQSEEDAGSDPVSCRCKSCPWYRRARSTTVVQPHDKRPTRGPTPPAHSGILGRGTLALNQRCDGSIPSPGTRLTVSPARLAQLAEAACPNQVCSEFESPGAHERNEPTALGYPTLNREMRVRIPPGASP